jgi:D-alanyl-D-alanine carboxypeptidase/D-alanyl-D-alanine-endopeptidase (penicillin-binding protein 4)
MGRGGLLFGDYAVWRAIIIFCIICLLTIQATGQGPDLATRLRAQLSDPLLANSQIGLSIHDITADRSQFRFNDTTLFIPASNMKLFTSAATLKLLRPSYRFKTRFLYRGNIANGLLNGDLVIIGGGDPLISGRFRNSITEVLELWADSIKARGIMEINGGIVVDNSLFSGPDLGPGWSWDDLTYWYACPVSALSFNDNCVDLKFLPGGYIGDPAVIECNPHADYLTIHNNAHTLPAESSFTLDYYRIPHTNDVTFFGGIPISDTAGMVDYVSVHRPELYAGAVFQDVLLSRKFKISGHISVLGDMELPQKQVYAPENLIPLFEWQSESLGVVIGVINTNSQNLFAEQTLCVLGAEMEGEGSFKGGIKAAGKFFDSIGIGRADLVMFDGSGLSYINMVKPEALVHLLAFMADSPDFECYFESLGNPADDRSLRKRLVGVDARDKVRAKTGFIAKTSTFSGYVKGPKSGHLIAFSIMINNFACPREYAEAWEDKIVIELLNEF